MAKQKHIELLQDVNDAGRTWTAGVYPESELGAKNIKDWKLVKRGIARYVDAPKVDSEVEAEEEPEVEAEEELEDEQPKTTNMVKEEQSIPPGVTDEE